MCLIYEENVGNSESFMKISIIWKQNPFDWVGTYRNERAMEKG